MHRLGTKSITALVAADREVAWQILALNTEKAHNLKERAPEVIRIYRGLVDEDAIRISVCLLPRGSCPGHSAMNECHALEAASFAILLQASRLSTDLDGRRYTVTVRARDNAGNSGSSTSLVTVPHDQGH